MASPLLVTLLLLPCALALPAPPPPPITLPLTLFDGYMYYTTIAVGSPPRPFTVVIDTGSSDLLIPRVNCTNCAGDPSLFYDCKLSNTCQVQTCSPRPAPLVACATCTDNQCGYSVSYVGVSEHARAVLDSVTLSSSVPAITSYFGAVDNITMAASAPARPSAAAAAAAAAVVDPDFYPLGMWGMAYAALNVEKVPTLFDAFVQQSSPRARDVFALCLGSSTGILTLGGEGSSHEQSSVNFTPIVSTEGFYTVWMDSVSVDDVPLNTTDKVLNKRGTIVDSGTVLPTLPTQAFAALRRRFEQLCESAHWRGVCRDVVAANATLFDGVCYNYTLAELSTFPRISFALRNNVTIELPPSLYMRNNSFLCPDPTSYALSIGADDDFAIIGAYAMQHQEVVFDRENSRIGFARAEC